MHHHVQQKNELLGDDLDDFKFRNDDDDSSSKELDIVNEDVNEDGLNSTVSFIFQNIFYFLF